jgi:hypothetical protein
LRQWRELYREKLDSLLDNGSHTSSNVLKKYGVCQESANTIIEVRSGWNIKTDKEATGADKHAIALHIN